MDSGWLPAPLADDVVDLATDHIQDFSLFPDFYMGDFGDSMAPGGVDLQGGAVFSTDLGGALRGNLPSPDTASSNTNPDMEDSVEFHTPRILDPVDNRPICAALRVQLDEMANSSSMVRCAMTAFAALQSRPKGSNPEYYRKYYDEASAELSNKFHQRGEKNILTNCGELGWSDARAAVAGGQGHIVNDTTCTLPPTPGSTTSATPSSRVASNLRPPSNSNTYDATYEILCQPGINFFEETQTITGRITRIAHRHRSRGSVEDETEVMAIAADILKDLSCLYNRRPALMDDAVAGNMDHVLMEPLASAVSRSFQTYIANFYVCYIHLHRVAHRHLVNSEVVLNAIGKIKDITHHILRNNESLPVNMLWPLFMWGSEEEDESERRWIVESIRNFGGVATNANMAADVLQEIQKRQKEGGTRVDIRSVCVELFDTTFAII
ncbi:hypothetical protein K4F52_005690 [Lecanicillium sp. MT-2017a]|nr:hypothetical protein K4F52_005690 [Lecanicillium sp. MT-2017a]